MQLTRHIVVIFLFGLAVAANSAPLPAKLPDVLLEPPPHASLSADGIRAAREAGATGYIPSAETLSSQHSPENWAPETGYLDAFPRVALDMDLPHFAPDTLDEELIGKEVLDGLSPAASGIVLDTQANALAYHFLWDGYAYTEYTRREVAGKAASAGREMGRQLASALPESDWLVLGLPPGETGPLWWPFFRGLVSAAPSGGPRVHLMLNISRDRAAWAPLQRLRERAESFLQLQLGEDLWRKWRRQGNIGFRVACDPGGPAIGDEDRQTDLALFAARAASDRYVIAHSPPWEWEPASLPLGPGSIVLNGSAAAVRLPRDVTFRTPLESHQRVGQGEYAGKPALVFWSEEGAAVLLWDESAEAVVFENRTRAIAVHHLTLGNTEFHYPKQDGDPVFPPETGRVTVDAFEGPAIVDRLPPRDYAWPAALWMDFEGMTARATWELDMRYGFANRTGLSFRGALQMLTSPHYAARPANMPLELAAGEDLAFRGALRGSLRLNEPVEVQLVLVQHGGGAISQSFEYTPGPFLAWKAYDIAPSAGPPLIASRAEEEGRVIVTADTAGGVSARDLTGALVWRREVGAPFTGAGAVGRDTRDNPLVAFLDQRGRLRAFSSDGEHRWAANTFARGTNNAAHAQQLHGYPGTEFVITAPGAGLQAFHAGGEPLWSHRDPGGRLYSAVQGATPDRPARIALASSHQNGMLTILDGLGEIQWSTPLAGPPAMAPVFLENEAGSDELVTVSANGTVEHWDVDEQQRLAVHDIAELASAQGLVALADPSGALRYVAATPGAVIGFDEDFELLWRNGETQPLSAPALDDAGDMLRILTATDDGVAAFDETGELLWRERRAALPPAGPPVALPREPGRTPLYAYTSADHFLRLIAPQQ
ncbi:MAG: PQQ-binding-like beta-propeller repeat protein [Candidatus Hydrogenedentota bacterium]